MSDTVELVDAALHQPIDLDYFAHKAQRELQEGRLIPKLGVAALLLDADNRMLVSVHEGRIGEFEQHSIGVVSETISYVKDANGRRLPESPYATFQRGLDEELAALRLSQGLFHEAGLYFDRPNPLIAGAWSLGARDGYDEVYVDGFAVVARITDPEVWQRQARSIPGGRLSQECLGIDFMTIDEIQLAASRGRPMRPGFLRWLETVADDIQAPTVSEPIPITWRSAPAASEDVVYPFIA